MDGQRLDLRTASPHLGRGRTTLREQPVTDSMVVIGLAPGVSPAVERVLLHACRDNLTGFGFPINDMVTGPSKFFQTVFDGGNAFRVAFRRNEQQVLILQRFIGFGLIPGSGQAGGSGKGGRILLLQRHGGTTADALSDQVQAVPVDIEFRADLINQIDGHIQARLMQIAGSEKSPMIDGNEDETGILRLPFRSCPYGSTEASRQGLIMTVPAGILVMKVNHHRISLVLIVIIGHEEVEFHRAAALVIVEVRLGKAVDHEGNVLLIVHPLVVHGQQVAGHGFDGGHLLDGYRKALAAVAIGKHDGGMCRWVSPERDVGLEIGGLVLLFPLRRTASGPVGFQHPAFRSMLRYGQPLIRREFHDDIASVCALIGHGDLCIGINTGNFPAGIKRVSGNVDVEIRRTQFLADNRFAHLDGHGGKLQPVPIHFSDTGYAPDVSGRERMGRYFRLPSSRPLRLRGRGRDSNHHYH